MAKEIHVLVVEPGKAPRTAKVEASMEAFAEAIGGPVEVGCYLPQRIMLICRDDSRGLAFNRTDPGTGERIAGPFLLCGFEDDSFISLTDAQMAEFQHHFSGMQEGGES